MLTQTYYPIESITFYFCVIAVLEALAIYTWQFRKMPGAITAASAQVCKAIWILSMVLCSTSTTLVDKVFWVTVQKLAGSVLVCLWVIFSWQFWRRKNRLTPVAKYSLFGSLCLIWLLIIIMNWNGLIWGSAYQDGQQVVFDSRIGQAIIMGYSFLLGCIATFFAIRWITTSVGLRRKQAVCYFGAVLISWASFILWKVSGQQINIVIPLGFLLNGIAITWIYYRWPFYNLLSLAQSAAIQNIVEGLLIIDDENYIVYVNPMAKTMLNGLPVVVGSEFRAVAKAWPVLSEVDATVDSEVIEGEREQTEGHCFYQLLKIPLQSSGKHFLGRIILLKDITEQRRHQAQMLEQQKSVVIMEERASLARELHDNLCQILGYINVQSQTVTELTATGQTAAAVSGLSRLTYVSQQAYDDVRQYISGVQTEKMMEKGLAEALREYVGWLRREYALNFALDISKFDQQELDAALGMELLRIVQEALTNSLKHADASQVSIALTIDADVARVVVNDDGKGFNPFVCSGGKGYGLTSMRERAEKAGGSLEIVSTPGHGTKVVVEVPLKKE